MLFPGEAKRTLFTILFDSSDLIDLKVKARLLCCLLERTSLVFSIRGEKIYLDYLVGYLNNVSSFLLGICKDKLVSDLGR